MVKKIPYQFPDVPGDTDCIGHTIRREGNFPSIVFVAVFEYPTCYREYDGKNWKTIPKQ